VSTFRNTVSSISTLPMEMELTEFRNVGT